MGKVGTSSGRGQSDIGRKTPNYSISTPVTSLALDQMESIKKSHQLKFSSSKRTRTPEVEEQTLNKEVCLEHFL